MNSPDDWREMRKDNEQIKSLEAQVKELKEPSYEVNRLTTLLAETENARKWWQDKAKEVETELKDKWHKAGYEDGKRDGMKFAKEHTGYLNEVWERNEKIKDLTASVDKHKQDILDLVKALKESQLVGYKCEHIAKDEIGGDCVHCNLVVAENAVKHLQSEIAILRKPLEKIVDAKYARDTAMNCLAAQLEEKQIIIDDLCDKWEEAKKFEENAISLSRDKAELQKQNTTLHEMLTDTQRARDLNAKSAEIFKAQNARLQRELDAVATEEWDKLKDQLEEAKKEADDFEKERDTLDAENAELQKQNTTLHEMIDEKERQLTLAQTVLAKMTSDCVKEESQNARLKKALEMGRDMVLRSLDSAGDDEHEFLERANLCLQQLSNQGESK